MSVLEILVYPDKKLKKKSKPVKEFNGDLHKLLDDMAETMYDAPGVGLAAPQVGKNIRATVIDISTEDEESNLIELINPRIVNSSGSQESEEGCLSVPGFLGNIKRKLNVVVEAQDRDGNEMEIEASDLFSRVLQHEIDHLDGILFFDRMSKLRKEFFIKKLDKAFGLK